MTQKPLQRKPANTLNAVLKAIQTIDQEFPLQYMICLNEIAQHEGISLSELANKTNMPLSTVSRIIGALSKKRQKGKAFGLIEVTICPEERRRKNLSLTLEGRKSLSLIHAILEESPIH